jgi:hypothetical protein
MSSYESQLLFCILLLKDIIFPLINLLPHDADVLASS